MLRSLISGKPVCDSSQLIPDAEKTVCITGLREKSVLPYNGDPQYSALTRNTVRLILCRYIDMAVSAGFTTFISGLATGTDLWAAEHILRLREKDERIRLVGVMPFLRHAEHFSADYKAILRQAEERADHLVTTCPDPRMVYGKRRTEFSSPDLYRNRNYYMVDHSRAVIAFFEPAESRSGTAQTVNYASRCGKLIRSFGLQQVYSIIGQSGADLRRVASAVSFIGNVFAAD